MAAGSRRLGPANPSTHSQQKGSSGGVLSRVFSPPCLGLCVCGGRGGEGDLRKFLEWNMSAMLLGWGASENRRSEG